MDEDALLQQALAMSMQVDSEGAAGGSNVGAGTANSSGGVAAGGTAAKANTADVAMGEDDELARALMMSMEDHTEKPSASAQPLQDSEYLNSVLSSLPGVNPQDPTLQSAIESMKKGGDQKADTGSKGDKKDSDKTDKK
jgi:26S proteasome regulatory subunit N10